MSLQDAFDNMKSGLTKDSTSNSASVGSQVNVGPIKPVDRLTLEGSTPGDFRSQAAQPDPLAGNDKPVRSETSDQENAGG